MKITPDFEGRNDDYDEKTIRYWDGTDEEGYFYELYVLIDSKPAAIIVTDDGVSVDFASGECSHTNIIPKRLYGDQALLVWDQLFKIVQILEKTDIEGRLYSKKKQDNLYNLWKSLGEP